MKRGTFVLRLRKSNSETLLSRDICYGPRDETEFSNLGLRYRLFTDNRRLTRKVYVDKCVFCQ